MKYYVRVERIVYHEVTVMAETPEQAVEVAMILVRKQEEPTDYDTIGTAEVYDEVQFVQFEGGNPIDHHEEEVTF